MIYVQQYFFIMFKNIYFDFLTSSWYAIKDQLLAIFSLEAISKYLLTTKSNYISIEHPRVQEAKNKIFSLSQGFQRVGQENWGRLHSLLIVYHDTL